MPADPYLIGNAILGLIIAVGTLSARWSTQARARRREVRRLRADVEKLEGALHEHRVLLSRHGVPLPDVPGYDLPEEE